MKQSGFQERTYRRRVRARGLYRQEVRVGETDVYLLTDRPQDPRFLIQRVRFHRGRIEEYIHCRDRRFLVALKPLAVERTAAPIVREMARAAAAAGVGPMAAVAGAIAGRLGGDLLRRGCREVIVENGGDCFLRVARPVTVRVGSGDSPFGDRLALRVLPGQTPLGICTSSGTVGHSLSFGEADSVTILARSAALADAAATAVANRVRGEEDLEAAIARARSIRGVLGAVAVCKTRCAGWGGVQFI